MGRFPKIRAVVLMVCLCLLTSVAGYAECRSRDRGQLTEDRRPEEFGAGLKGRMDFLNRVLDQNVTSLEMTSQQLAKIREIRFSARRARIQKDADIAVVLLDMEQALQNADPDVPALGVLIEKKYRLKQERSMIVLNAYVGLLGVLTEAQKEAVFQGCGMNHCAGGASAPKKK